MEFSTPRFMFHNLSILLLQPFSDFAVFVYRNLASHTHASPSLPPQNGMQVKP